jgi:hypothetical protein
MTPRALLASIALLAAAPACTRTVEGSGGSTETTSATEPLPGLGDSCNCAAAEQGGASCCDGDLICQAPAGALPTCNTEGCSIKGYCAARDEAGH